jgi:glycosyltransferase involved in cell wall biosynthesis
LIKVSVIVPVFNKAPFLAACLESIAKQSLGELEIICVDDCSTDASAEIVRELQSKDGRIRLFSLPANSGPGAARNLGLAQAQGQYVQFTDADDLLPSGALQGLYQLATETGAPVVRGSLGNQSPGRDGVWSAEEHRMPDRRAFRLEDERRLWIPYFHVCFLFERRFLLENGIRYPEMRCGEDPIFLASCLLKTPTLSTASAVSYIYCRGASAWQERRTFAHALDFIMHVSTLKRMYLASSHAACWNDTCEDFFAEEIRLVVSQTSVTPAEMEQLQMAMRALIPAPPVASAPPPGSPSPSA